MVLRVDIGGSSVTLLCDRTGVTAVGVRESREALGRTEGPLLLIVGSGRSGTSLISAMIDAHPDVSLAPESHLLPRLLDALPETLTTSSHVDGMVSFIGRSKWFEVWKYDLETLRDVLEEALPIVRADALVMIYRVHAALAGKSRFGEKTPAYVYSITALADALPSARFIHIVRDGRNVALSFKEVDFGSDDLEHTILNWQRRVLAGRKMGELLGPGRYLEVKYEDLVVDTEQQLRGVTDFIDLPYSDEMLRYYEDRDSYWTSMSSSRKHVSSPPKKTRDWRDQLSPREHARLELLGSRALRAFGYELTARPSTGDRIAAVRARTRWWIYRAKSKTGLARRGRGVFGRQGAHAEVRADD